MQRLLVKDYSATMTIIRVTPSILTQSGQDLAQAGTNTSRVGNDVWNVGSSAPGYDGQFGSAVRGMAAEANARAQAFARQLAEYTSRLQSKATAFEAADQALVSGLGAIGLPNDWREALNLLGQFGLWAGMPIAALEQYLSLGLLTNLDPWLSQLVTGIITRSNLHVGWNGSLYQGVRVPPSLTQTIERLQNDLSGKGWKTDDELAEEKQKADEAKREADQKAKQVATVKHDANVVLSQNDPRWANEMMGENGDYIGGKHDGVYGVGCLITVIAMLGRYYGHDVYPNDVNDYLRQHQGYASDSSMMEPPIALNYLNSIGIKDKPFVPLSINDDSISTALAKNPPIPVILHIPSSAFPNDGHYVLAYGNGDKRGTFWVLDPATGGKRLINVNQVTGAQSLQSGQ